jgi:hypothetical protein
MIADVNTGQTPLHFGMHHASSQTHHPKKISGAILSISYCLQNLFSQIFFWLEQLFAPESGHYNIIAD